MNVTTAQANQYNNAEENSNAQTIGKKGKTTLIGGLSHQNCFSFIHTLQVLSSCIKHLLIFETFNYVLAGRMHNDLIEHHFGITRGIVDSNRHLDCPSFMYAQQGFTIKHLYVVCRNEDRSHNREMYQKIFEEIKEIGTELKT